MSLAPSDPLAGLRDYHLPPSLSWWPPAPGWWGIVAAVLLIGLLWWLVRWWRQRRERLDRLALAELATLRRHWHSDQDALELARGLSRLLKRYAMERYPDDAPAGLCGEPWIAFLDRHGGQTRMFADGVGRALIDAPYRRQAEVEGEHLLKQVERWIRENPMGRS